jgi:hypothetical protein
VFWVVYLKVPGDHQKHLIEGCRGKESYVLDDPPAVLSTPSTSRNVPGSREQMLAFSQGKSLLSLAVCSNDVHLKISLLRYSIRTIRFNLAYLPSLRAATELSCVRAETAQSMNSIKSEK